MPRDLGERPVKALAPNKLARQFAASRPDERWVADLTYIWTAEGWLFLAVVLDLFSRRVVGWSMQSRMSAELVTDALVMALWRRRPGQALLHHSDQGSQYTSALFQRLLELHGIECSLSRRGECWDNAAMESFFSSLKSERLNRRTYRSRDDVRADVFSYIEQFYNPRRRHSTLGYVSPMEYEKQAGFRLTRCTLILGQATYRRGPQKLSNYSFLPFPVLLSEWFVRFAGFALRLSLSGWQSRFL